MGDEETICVAFMKLLDETIVLRREMKAEVMGGGVPLRPGRAATRSSARSTVTRDSWERLMSKLRFVCLAREKTPKPRAEDGLSAQKTRFLPAVRRRASPALGRIARQ